ncbi:MAG: hypothetical protein J6O55_01245 [Lachnospiraceae bacterium]|nr:hypothetical protein [Lachnospiraceae bacterium]
MPNTAEVVEKLAGKLERQKILIELKDCETIQDFKKLQKKYELLCEEDARDE